MRSTSVGHDLLKASDYERGVRILALSLFRELMSSGYQTRHVILLSAELIGLVIKTLRH